MGATFACAEITDSAREHLTFTGSYSRGTPAIIHATNTMSAHTACYPPIRMKLCGVSPIGKEPCTGSHNTKVVCHEKKGANNLDLDHT